MKKKVLLVGAPIALMLSLGGLFLTLRHHAGADLVAASRAAGGNPLSASVGDVGAGLREPTESYDLSSHQTLSRVILLIRENYVDPDRIRPYEMFLLALDYIEKAVPEVIIDESQAPQRVRVSFGSDTRDFDLGGLDQLWEVTMALRDIFRFLQSHLDDAEKRRDIEYAAINGMLSALDPHSIFLKPESFDEVKLSTKGEFGGLGIVISIRDGSLTIISPIIGTPAARAGLKSQDKIVKIGEESTINMGLEEAVGRLRGKAGTDVAIWILRDKWPEPHKFVLTRAVIKIESVTSELLKDDVGYIRIKSFQNNTYDDLHAHLGKLRKKAKKGLKGLVLDMRNNPGGLLDQAILVSDRFIERGPLVITVGEGNRKREVKRAHFSGTERDLPVAVLVNGGSASASEIVAGALQNHDRAVIIGQQTFGKGSVQVLYDFKDRSALKLTIAQYLTPGDISIQSVGITPDVAIVPASLSKERVHLFVDNESPREKDLAQHLDGQTGAQKPGAKSAQVLTHLVQEDDNPATPETPEDPDKFVFDFEIEVAQEILQRAPSTDRNQMLRAAEDVFVSRRAREELKVVEKLKTLGVDWVQGEPADVPGSARLQLKSSTGDNQVTAGDTVTLEATVTNTGNKPMFRAYAVSKSDHPLLDNLEFVFGRVDPGTSRNWKVDVKLPKDGATRTDEITLTLSDGRETVSGVETSLLLGTKERGKPRFAYSFHIDDRKTGNGDGVLQAGEAVDLVVDVQNTSTTPAEETLVTLKNMAGESVFLDRGRFRMESVPAGKIETAQLRFSVRKPEKDVVPMRLSVWDTALGASISEVLNLPIEPAGERVATKQIVAGGQGGTVVYAGASTRSPVMGRLAEGATVRTDTTFRNEWRRVKLPGTRGIGYVRNGDVTVAKVMSLKTKDGFAPEPGQATPSLVLNLARTVTDTDRFNVSGQISDERVLRDVFAFVNDKKVFYQDLSKAARVQGGTGVRAPLELSLPLKEGTNNVAIIAREDENVMTRTLFSVYRTKNKLVAGAVPTAPVGPLRE